MQIFTTPTSSPLSPAPPSWWMDTNSSPLHQISRCRTHPLLHLETPAFLHQISASSTRYPRMSASRQPCNRLHSWTGDERSGMWISHHLHLGHCSFHLHSPRSRVAVLAKLCVKSLRDIVICSFQNSNIVISSFQNLTITLESPGQDKASHSRMKSSQDCIW